MGKQLFCEIILYYYGPYTKGFNNTFFKSLFVDVQIEFLGENNKYIPRQVKEAVLFFLNICIIPTTWLCQLFYKIMSRSLLFMRGLRSNSVYF